MGRKPSKGGGRAGLLLEARAYVHACVACRARGREADSIPKLSQIVDICPLCRGTYQAAHLKDGLICERNRHS